jgi:hypothetical protein
LTGYLFAVNASYMNKCTLSVKLSATAEQSAALSHLADAFVAACNTKGSQTDRP